MVFIIFIIIFSGFHVSTCICLYHTKRTETKRRKEDIEEATYQFDTDYRVLRLAAELLIEGQVKGK